MAPTLKLTYFDARGRAEATRLALCIGGIEFEDKRVTGDEFAALKPTLPFGQVPVLEVDGEMHAQTGAFLHYTGKLAGLYPKDPLEALRVDEIVLALEDMTAAIIPVFYEKDEAKKAEMIKECVDVTMPKWLSSIEKRIVGRGCEWAAGDTMSIADLCIYSYWVNIAQGALAIVPTNYLEPYTKLSEIGQKVADHPKVKEWNEKH
ncbi:unnamed protein product [Ostreobium quekettii]|uniref:Glutathione S-transferase n=1 Tax=Ostreobium quekettii TaxID=121088 RepID=A0A8S1IYW1_9CHLO|nr:unnamed protein product [Ostreobium quekettii]|eukprot:evm.model.scf_1064EXC.4 EVM.evm.TU.scf_1064EXC.4   scf_1064EXC:40763-42353(-)